MTTPLAALSEETARSGELFDSLGPDDYARPTRCEPLSVLELGAHAWRGSVRILEMTEAGPLEDQPTKDAVTYFVYDADAEAPMIARRAREAAQSHSAETFADAWRSSWSAALDAAQRAKQEGVYVTVFGSLKMSEYLKTRVLEVTIHTMDIRDALGLAPDPTDAGLTVTCDVLRGLLGTDLRPLGIDDVRFALTGTGRAVLDAAEREMLGPLAGLFPLLR
jgi:uncharacterized protein (TIGR03083 family)